MEILSVKNGVLMGYFGHDKVVVVPDGIRAIGGLLKEDENCPLELRGEGSHGIGYKAFYGNKEVEVLFIPDSVEELGFKSLEHCSNMRILSFSVNLKKFGANCLTGCEKLKTIVYRGTVFEFSRLDLGGNVPDLEMVFCNDGVINFQQEKYVEVLHFPGSKVEWENGFTDDWLSRRCKKNIFSDGEILELAK